MKKEFAITENVKKFAAAVKSIIDAPAGVDRMALVYGDPGLGKTETALWWVNQFGNGAAFVRIIKLMSGRWMLSEIANELGESPAWKTQDLFKQITTALSGTDRVIILDEVDYLAHDARVLETVRDIHDQTNAPIVLIGMNEADRKLKRYRHLWRRFSEVVKFEPLGVHDIRNVFDQISEIEVDNSVIEYVHKSGELTVSMLYRWTQRFERIAKRNNAERITIDDLK